MYGYLSTIPAMIRAGIIPMTVYSYIQVNIDTFMAKVQEGKKGNVLIVKGGLEHFDPINYIVNYMSYELQDYNVFMFVKNYPVIERKTGQEIHDCLTVIRGMNDLTTILCGFSMGGISVLSYLSNGYMQPDFVCIVCSTIDFDRLNDLQKNDFFVRMIKDDSLTRFGYPNLDEAYKSLNVDPRIEMKRMQSIRIGLMMHQEWKARTFYVIGERDRITKQVNWPFATKKIVVEEGGHCDSKVMDTVVKMIGNMV